MAMVTLPPTAHFVISYDDSLTNGPALADAVHQGCEASLAAISALFGGIMPPPASLPFTVQLVPGAGGASHPGCASTAITAFCSANSDTIGVPAVVNAEIAEVFESVQGQGLDCGGSAGEALSRVTPTILDPSLGPRFSTGSDWLNSPTRPNWVDATEPTDQNFVSIGCGSLFFNYLHSQLGFAWTDIVAASAPTLGQLATGLGLQNAFQTFKTLIDRHYPPGTPVSLPDDNPFPLPDAILYLRHNLADDGTSHSGPLAKSPDIIVRNAAVADPQTTFSTPASIASDVESDPFVESGQPNFVYLRVWNRGLDATDVTATAYWSPPATLVTPNLWNLIGSVQFPDVPAGRVVQVSDPGLTWNTVPAAGHYCFVATVGNAEAPAPTPDSFATFDDFMRYIRGNNNITWRNFDVVAPPGGMEPMIFPFLIVGAWDVEAKFVFAFGGHWPHGARVALDVPRRLGRLLKGNFDLAEEGEGLEDGMVRLLFDQGRSPELGEVELPAGTVAQSRLRVELAKALEDEHEVGIVQIHDDREIGRITWRVAPRLRDDREASRETSAC